MYKLIKSAMLMAACIGIAPCLVAQEFPLTVNTQFVIEAKTLQIGLGDAAEQVEKAVAEKLATEVNRYFGFLSWSASASSDAQLTLKLVAETKPLGVAINLEYAPRVRLQGFPLQIPPEEIYDEFDEQPKDRSEAQRLIDDVSKAIVSRFQNEAFRNEFEARFVRHIPLTAQFDIDANNKSILIPLSIRQLQAGDLSKMVIEFKAKNASQVTQDGGIQLGTPGSRDDRPGWAQWGVIRFWYLPDDHSSWHDSIPDVLNASQDLFVYMLEYDADSSAGSGDGGLVDDIGGDQP